MTSVFVPHAATQTPHIILSLATSIGGELTDVKTQQALNGVRKLVTANDLVGALVEMTQPLAAMMDVSPSDVMAVPPTTTPTPQERSSSALSMEHEPFDGELGLSLFLAVATSIDALKTVAKPLCTALSQYSKHPEVTCQSLVCVFDALPMDSPLRYHVYQILLDYCVKHKLLDTCVTFETTPEHVRTWCETWCGKDLLKVREMFLKVSQAFELVRPEQSQTFLLAYLSTFSGAGAGKNEIPPLQAVRQVALNAIRSSTALASFQILAFPPMKLLKDQDPKLYQLLEIVCGDSIEAFTKFAQANAQVFQATKLDSKAILDDMRLLTLVSLGAQESNALSYSHVASKLGLEKKDFEEWMVSAIGRGVVEAKIDQLNETIVITKVSCHIFRDEDWINISSQLKKWRASVRKVTQTLEAAAAAAATMQAGGGSAPTSLAGGGVMQST